MEHDCPLCGKRIYNHKGACYDCRGKFGAGQGSEVNKTKALVATLLMLFVGLLIFSAYEYLRNKGFTHYGTISFMISIPIILAILIFKGKMIYKTFKYKDRHTRKKAYFWIAVIVILILIILYFQFANGINLGKNLNQINCDAPSGVDIMDMGSEWIDRCIG